jgi:AcrR family transcriptional regulator
MAEEKAPGEAIATAVRTNVVAEDTRERILESAVAVLADVGHGQFSVQKVARHAGVYQGNITYYWPRRRDLMLSLALRVAGEHRATFLARFESIGADATERAASIVRVMMEDAVAPQRARLLPELWSMANADPEVAREVQRCQHEMLEVALEHLRVSGRRCSGVVRDVLHVILAVMAGLPAVLGDRASDDPVRAALIDAVVDLHAPRLADALAGCRD